MLGGTSEYSGGKGLADRLPTFHISHGLYLHMLDFGVKVDLVKVVNFGSYMVQIMSICSSGYFIQAYFITHSKPDLQT